ncbi:MAG TPA: NAD(P)/FAD-dependent oxidoreductase [Candidatus Cryosericum sp.]
MREINADVIVVGAGSAGSYLAWHMAQAGLKVVVLEARRLDDLGTNIEVFHMDRRAFAEFDIPEPVEPELIHLETRSFMWSPDRSVCEKVDYPFFVMNMPLFYQRIHSYGRSAGVLFLESHVVTAPIIEGVADHGAANHAIVGMRGHVASEQFEARGRLVVDASGMTGALRTRLPGDLGVETDPIDSADVYSCCLELRTETGPEALKGSNSFIAHKGFWNRSYGDDVIIGMSRPADYDDTWEKHAEFREEYFGDPGRVVGRREGKVPFRRSLLSCVGPGFLIVGDAAFQNRPFSGEGVVSGIAASAIAARVAVAALKSGSATVGALWPYNVEYFRGQGAKFAASYAQLPAAAELSRKDIDYLYRKHVIFAGEDFEELNTTYELRMGPVKIARMVWVLASGVLTGRFDGLSLCRLLAATRKAGRLKKHFLRYPVDPADFPGWEAKALELWGEEKRA